MGLGSAWAAQRAAAASAAYTRGDQQEDDGGGGLFGLPNLGLTTLFKEFSAIPTGLVGLGTAWLPGGAPAGETYSRFARGFGGSVLGTVSTAGKAIGVPGTEWNLGDKVVEPLGAKVVGEQYRPKDFFEKARERGILPALVEDVGNVALVAGAAKGVATNAATAASEAGNTSRAATLAARAQRLEKWAHPYVFTGEKIRDLASAAKLAVEPPAITGSGVGRTASEIVSDTEGPVSTISEPANQSLIDIQNVVGEAAGSVRSRQRAREIVAVTEEVPEGLSSEAAQGSAEAGKPGRALNQEALRAHNSTLPEPEPTRTVFRGEDGVWTVDERRVVGPEKYRVDVPKSVWKGDGTLPEEWSKVAEQIEGPQSKPQITRERQQKGVTPDESTVIDDAVSEARQANPRPEVLDEIASKIAPSPWAVSAVEKLPDIAKRTLALLDRPITKGTLRRVERELSRHVRIAQNMARSSPAVQAALQAAEQILAVVPETDRFRISEMVGQEIAKRVDGTAMLEAMVRDGNSAEAAAALRRTATNHMPGIPQEILDQMDAETRGALEDALGVAEEALKVERKAALQQMLAARGGSRGLEHAILETDSPLLTRAQLRLYNQAKHDLTRAAKMRERVPDERAAQAAEIERVQARKDRKSVV